MKKQSETIQKGYKRIPQTNLAVNEFGTVYNIDTGHTRTPRNVVTSQYGRITIEKLLLWVFRNETPRAGHIMYIDGQKSNKSLNNVKYATPKEHVTPVILKRTDLITALRCYIQIEKKSKPNINQLETKVYLLFVATKRAFLIENQNKPFFDVFFDWVSNNDTTAAKTAKAHNISHRAARSVINQYTNKLTASVCNDLKEGVLKMQPFLPTDRERRKAITKLFIEFGIKPPEPFKVSTDIKAKFKEVGLKPPPANSKESVWLNEALICLTNAPIENNEVTLKGRAELLEMIKKMIFDFYAFK